MRGGWFHETDSNIAVVFLHGILSSRFSSWYNENNKSYWPRILKNCTKSEDISIYTYSYYTGVRSGNYGVNNIVRTLALKLEQDEVLLYNKIIFVGHSMGGIVARRYLVEQEKEIESRRIVMGLMLLGSPSRGSIYANIIGSIARKIMPLLRNKQLEDLYLNSSLLETLHQDFLRTNKNLPIHGQELIESKSPIRFRILPRVVNSISAHNYFPNAQTIANSTHSSIAKPRDKNSEQHLYLIKLIKSVSETNTPVAKYRESKKKWANLINAFGTPANQLITSLRILGDSTLDLNLKLIHSNYQEWEVVSNKIKNIISHLNNYSSLKKKIHSHCESLYCLYRYINSRVASKKSAYMIKLNDSISNEEIDFAILSQDINIVSKDNLREYVINWNLLINTMESRNREIEEELIDIDFRKLMY